MTLPSPGRLAGPARHDSIARVSLVLLLALAFTGCGGKGAGGRGGFAMPPSPVEVAEVRSGAVRDLFRALGSLDALQEADVVAEVSGRVLALPFPEGRSVDSGAVLARLDDRELRAQRDRSSAAVELARSEARRVEDLYAREVVSPRERDESRATLAAAEADLALQQTRFERTTIRAPFSGVTGRRLVSTGSVVRVNDAVVHLARLDRLRVQFAVPERYAAVLRPGARATVQVTAWPGQDFPAWVTVVEPSIDPKTRTFTAVAEVRNLRERLRPGMSASVSVSLAERMRALTVPDEAVLAEGDQAFVYKVGPDSSVARVPVQLGTREAAQVEIVSGLSEGDRVVRAGHQKLYPGAKVIPILAGAGTDSSSTAAPAGR